MVKVVEGRGMAVEVVSVYEGCVPHSHAPRPPAAPPTTTPAPSTCVWVCAKDAHGRYLDPVKIQGLLALHARQIATATNLTVTAYTPPLDDSPATADGGPADPDPHLHSATSLASTSPPLQVCGDYCCFLWCLVYRCVCPGGTSGSRCKVLSRTFRGSGWAWLPPLPPCLPATLSLRLLTRRPHALLLYAGPLAPILPRATPPMLALQLVEGRPQALLQGAGGFLRLQVNASLSDGRWHSLHLTLDHQTVVLMVDLCGRGWEGKTRGDAHCLARAEWRSQQGGGPWLSSAPLQVGGLAHPPPQPEHHGWHEAPTHHHLTGCLARLTINNQVRVESRPSSRSRGHVSVTLCLPLTSFLASRFLFQLIDLGEPAYSYGSVAGCRPQDTACPGGCGLRGQCTGGLLLPWCECEPGWTGSGCSTPTVPSRLGAASYMKVALSFTPAPRVVKLQARVRFRGARSGLLLHLATHHRAAAITLHLQAGVACASVSGAGWAARRVCVARRPLGDGAWHTVVAERHGHNVRVSVDDGDGWCLNESLASVHTAGGAGAPPPLMLDKHDGVTVGGLPEFLGVNLVTVHDDLQDTCLDDLRVSDHQLPLPPAVNGTSWGQVTTMQHMVQGCHPAGDPCANTSCAAPLACRAAWDQPSCRCGPGTRLVGGACEDVDECLWRPCLHGGSCLNLQPGYLCVCAPGHLGDHCQWSKLASNGHPAAAPAAIAAIAVSILVLVVVGVVVSLRLHRLRGAQGLQAGAVKGVKGAAVEGDEEQSVGETAVQGGSNDTLMELLKLRVSRDPSGLSEDGSAAPAGWEGRGGVLLVDPQHTSLHPQELPAHPCGPDASPPHLASPAPDSRTRVAVLPTKCPAVGVIEAGDPTHHPPEAPLTATPPPRLLHAGTEHGTAARDEGEAWEEHCALTSASTALTVASPQFVSPQPDRHTLPAAASACGRNSTPQGPGTAWAAGGAAASPLDPHGLAGPTLRAQGGGPRGEEGCGNCVAQDVRGPRHNDGLRVSARHPGEAVQRGKRLTRLSLGWCARRGGARRAGGGRATSTIPREAPQSTSLWTQQAPHVGVLMTNTYTQHVSYNIGLPINII
ncbi:Neural-cadherin [Chionoecetes opilio]|uniref:Neural-cadherin n=1 Tax=Chionoecetes opilio TaxID=41210 RepID=A0A8J4YD93_CHIOP|nr:Neural-cadherin [Chionoecetes opilio]